MCKKLFLPLTAILLLTTACSSDSTFDDNIPVIGEAERSAGQIAFSPMEIGSHNSEIVTRAAQTTTSTITSYGVTSSVCDATTGSYATAECGSYFYNEEIAAATGRCKYYWPGSSYKISFFAYAPYGEGVTLSSPKTKAGFPVYSYTVPQGVAAQLDFMTADVLDRVATPTTTPVTLTFYHRCSDIRFNVTNRNTSYDLTVKSITLCGMKYSGSFEGDTWTLTGSPNTASNHPFTYTVQKEIEAGATVDVTETENHFMVLPQTIAAGTNFIVVKTTEYGAEKTYIYNLDAALTLEKGKSYTFNLIIGDGQLIVDPDTDVNDWEVTQVYLNGSVDANPQEPSDQNIGGGTVTINDWQ